MKKLLITSTLVCFIVAAQADVFSNLIVVKEAAQTGIWTTVLTGQMPNGIQIPPQAETMCVTKEQIIQNFNKAMYYNTKTGKENKDCPTVLTTNTSTLGIAKMTCPAQAVVVGKKQIKIPEITAITEFKKINKNMWTMKFGTMTSTITYSGSATANCVSKK